eukprot:2623975-Heterocapsa_arctica.AAC.1
MKLAQPDKESQAMESLTCDLKDYEELTVILYHDLVVLFGNIVETPECNFLILETGRTRDTNERLLQQLQRPEFGYSS